LHEWHNLDEVDSYEVWRSESIEDWQGNVNPFVMDTTLVRRAYFTEDGGTDPDPDPEFEEIFTETFGSVSATTDISDHTFDNSEFTFEGNGDIRESIPSEGYSEASGDAQIFMNLGYKYLTISGINTEGYEQISLQYGIYANSSDPILIEYSEDEGGSWQSLSEVPEQTANNWTLLHMDDTGLPPAEQLAIRFSKDGGQQYRLDDIRLEGVAGEATSNEGVTERAEQVSLHQNYPNPFNPATTIEFELPRQQEVRLAVYDMLGREVSLLADGIHSSGHHIYSWDASNFSSGIYIYTLETGSHRITRKMTLMK
ncbi:MAG: T9SS type A sorting domain-containing protein, partial [Balneolaceae bacterium]